MVRQNETHIETGEIKARTIPGEIGGETAMVGKKDRMLR